MENVKITTEYIKLDQFIKWVGICDSGANAKEMIADGQVKVNNMIESQRGKKLRIGDIIEISNKKYIIE